MVANFSILKLSWVISFFAAGINPFFSIPFKELAKSEIETDCGCDHVIPLSQRTVNANALDKPVEPGHKICLEAGEREWLYFQNFQGTKEKPIIITNCGGAVIIKNLVRNGVISFNDNRYFRFTGTGDPSIKYGINVVKGGIDTAIRVGGGCSDFEMDHIEVADAGFAGIMLKSDPHCNLPQYQRENYIMENVRVHDNYIHDVYGEGFYIGHYAYNGLDAACGTIYPHLIKNLKLYNNIVRDTGADGIQVACAPEGTEIYNNLIENYGKEPFADFQDNGLIVGNQALIYNNVIKNGKGIGAGIQVFGGGGIKVFNNIIINSGNMGIFCDERTEVVGEYYFINNTIINSKDWGIRLYGDQVPKNHFKNNIIVSEHGKFLMKINNNVKLEESHNLYETDVNKVLFVDPINENYKLKPGSPAIDAGMDVSNININFDFNNLNRPFNETYDIGAHEFGSLVTSSEIQEHVLNAKNDFLEIFPNPSDNHVTIKINKHSSEIRNIKLYNVNGKVMVDIIAPESFDKQSASYLLDVHNLKKNIYIVLVETNNGFFREKLILK